LQKSAIIAALYIVIGLVFQPWEFGPLQFRPSEMLICGILYAFRNMGIVCVMHHQQFGKFVRMD
jgi:uncharacterized membrane protein